MKPLLLIPVFLSFLLLAAHFLRGGGIFLSLGTIAMAFLLVIPRPWSARLVQAALALGTLEWLRTLVTLAASRVDNGEPVGRLVIILSAVAAFTFCSILVFRTPTLRRAYGLKTGASSGAETR